MGFYGNMVLESANNTFVDTISVVFDEYCNYSQLLESCLDEKEKAVLEAKVEVLYEVSMKDIKSWIKKQIDRIVEIIRKAWEYVKEFFKSKKTKAMEEEIKNLKNNIAVLEKNNVDMEALYKASLSDAKIASKETEDNIKRHRENLEKFKSSMDDHIATLNDTMSKTVAAHKDSYNKLKSEYESQGEKISKFLAKLANNKYIHFDMYDYIVKDYDPLRIVRGNSLRNLTTLRSDKEKDEAIERTNKKILEYKYYEIIHKDVLDYMEKEGRSITSGGYDHIIVNEYIEKHLEEQLKDKKFTIDNLVKHLEWLTHGYQITACSEICGKYNEAAKQLENYLGKYLNYDRNGSNNPAEDSYQIRANSHDMYEYKDVIEGIRNILKSIDGSTRYLSVICKYAGKASGVAEAALMSYKAFRVGQEK